MGLWRLLLSPTGTGRRPATPKKNKKQGCANIRPAPQPCFDPITAKRCPPCRPSRLAPHAPSRRVRLDLALDLLFLLLPFPRIQDSSVELAAAAAVVSLPSLSRSLSCRPPITGLRPLTDDTPDRRPPSLAPRGHSPTIASRSQIPDLRAPASSIHLTPTAAAHLTQTRLRARKKHAC